MLIKRALLSLLCVLCMTSISYAQQKLSTGGVTMGQSKSEVAAVLKSKGNNYKESSNNGIDYISLEDINVGGVIFDGYSFFKFKNNQLFEVYYQMNNAIGTSHYDALGFANAKIDAQKIQDAYNSLVHSLSAKYGDPQTITGSSASRKYITWRTLIGTITLEYHYKSGYDNMMYPNSETISAGLALKYVDSSMIATDL